MTTIELYVSFVVARSEICERVFGVDLGLSRCGLNVAEGGVSQSLRMIAIALLRPLVTDESIEADLARVRGPSSVF